MLNWDLIEGKNVAVRCKTYEEAVEFDKEYSKRVPEDGVSASSLWQVYQESTCYRIIEDKEGKILSYCNINYWIGKKFKVIDFSEMKIPKIMSILGVEKNKNYKWRDKQFHFDDDFNLIEDRTQIDGIDMVEIINNANEIEEYKIKLTLNQLKDMVGFDFEIVE